MNVQWVKFNQLVIEETVKALKKWRYFIGTFAILMMIKEKMLRIEAVNQSS